MQSADDEYTTVSDQVAEGYYSEKRSKFLAFVHHVDSEDDVKKLIATYRKKYYDARHVCYAYVIGDTKNVFRANDDGEPSSTAGKPILAQIQKLDLTNVLVVVVRYYGGVNLGTGGLVVAYRTASESALSKAEKITCQIEEVVVYSFPYVMMNDVMRIVKELSPRIVSQTFENTCEIKLRIRRSQAELLRNRLNNLAFS